jgi:hypothetical protein
MTDGLIVGFLVICISVWQMALQNTGKLWIVVFRLLWFAVFLLVLSRSILPWTLHHLSKRIRVRSVSLRSIRGLYLRIGRVTVRVERIGLSYRRRSEEVTRRLFFRFQNIDIKVYPKTQRSPVSRRSRILPIITGGLHALSSALHSIISQSSVLDALYFSVSWWLRPFFRLYFVTAGRLLIRALPSIAQLMHLEIDNLTLRFTSMDGAGINATGLQASLSVLFTRLEQVVSAKYPELGKTGTQRSKTNSWSRSWGTRFWASASRTWEKAWGEAEGEASISLEIDRIQSIGPSDDDTFAQLCKSPRSGFNKTAFRNTEMSLGTIKLDSSCRFNPRLVRLHRESLRLFLDFSNIECIVSSKMCTDNDTERFPTKSHVTMAINTKNKDGSCVVSILCVHKEHTS